MTPSEWYINFLSKRGLSTSDGKPLYKYKVTDAEFYQLKKALMSTPTNYARWDACFVLYASEWWRRNYSEGYWSWEPIFDSIRLQVTVLQRNQLVESGFKCWKRKVHIDPNGHNDYLVTVITECGLPVETLAPERNNWLKQLMKGCYEDLRLITLTEYEPHEIVKQVAEQLRLPIGLKKPGFYLLIAQIVTEAINLKQQYKLGQEKSPTEFLDQHKPDWRDSFPIQIDTPVGKQFLDELLTEVAQLPEPISYRIALTRELINVHDSWKVKSTLHIPNVYYEKEELRISQDTTDTLPSKLDIELVDSSGERKQIGFAYKTQKFDKTGYKISDVGNYNLGSKQNSKTWTLFLSQQEKQFFHELPLPGGEPLDSDLPWTFVENRDGVWQLKATASYRTHAATAKIIAHKEWSKTGNLEKIGSFDSLRDIYLLKGEGIITSEDQKFRIVTNSEKSDNSYYVLQGNKFRLSQKGDDLYLGFPSLFKINNTTLSRTRLYQKVQLKKSVHNSWQECSADSIGSMKIRVLGDDSEVLYITKICVLPKDFDIAFDSISPTEGRINLFNSSLFTISLLGEDIEGDIIRTNSGHQIKINSLRQLPPKDFTLSLIEAESSLIKLQVPFPSNGSKFFDKNGKQLPNGSRQYLDELFGLRLVLFNPTKAQRTYSLVFELVDRDVHNVRFINTIQVDSDHQEISVSSYLDIMRKLFAVTENLDAEIRVRVRQGPSILIKNYVSKLLIDSENEVIFFSGALEDLTNASIQTFRLDEDIANQEVETIEPILENGVHSGKWKFNLTNRVSGKWLLYPGKDSAIMFRPRLWIVSHDETSDNELENFDYIKDSAHIRDRSERVAKLIDLVSLMAKDFHNSNWKEVKLLWKNTDHLPLNTFDVWTAFAKSEDALIALFFYMPSCLMDRINGEYPILLETLPLQKWNETAKRFHEHWQDKLPEYAGEIIENKLQYLESQFKLNCLARIIRSVVLGTDANELQLGSNVEFIKYQLNYQLNGGLGHQGLYQRNSNNRWPVQLNVQLIESFNNLPPGFSNIAPQSIQNYTKSVVYLPLILAAATVNSDVLKLQEKDFSTIYRIKEIQDFDREWFNTLYDFIQCFLWMNNKNN